MRLSFVIPAYNEEAYLPACLESIRRELARGNVSAEIIVVNNASTDRTRDIALATPGVTLVDEPRKGLTYARQAGFEASTGALIANVDSDSRLPEGWLAQVLSTFTAEPDIVALSGPVVYYDLTPRQALLVQLFYFGARISYPINRQILGDGSMVQGGNFVLARSALTSIGGFNLDISFYGEDTDIARRLNAIGKVRFTFDLKMFSSARRLKKEGMLVTAMRYSVNYFWTIFLERPFSSKYADIREQPQL